MAAEAKALLKDLPSVNETLKHWRRGDAVGRIGLLGYPPLFSVCRLLAAQDVDWGTGDRECRFTAPMSAELRAALKGESDGGRGSLVLHLVLFDPETDSVKPWPVHEGASEVMVYLDDQFLSFPLDEDGHVMKQLNLPIPQHAIGHAKALSFKLRQKGGRPARYAEEQTWCDVPTVLLLLVRRLEIKDMLHYYGSIPAVDVGSSAPGGGDGDGVTMLQPVSLKDPVSYGRMNPPMIRGLACTHLQCFDLSVSLKIMVERVSSYGGAVVLPWKCPVCGKPLSWARLVRDKRLEAYASDNPRVSEITVDVDGTTPNAFKIVDKKESDDDDDSASIEAPSTKRRRTTGRSNASATGRTRQRKQPAAKAAGGGRATRASPPPAPARAAAAAPAAAKTPPPAPPTRSKAGGPDTPNKQAVDAAMADNLSSLDMYVTVASHLELFSQKQQLTGDDVHEMLALLEDLERLKTFDASWLAASNLRRVVAKLDQQHSSRRGGSGPAVQNPRIARVAHSVLSHMDRALAASRITDWVSDQANEQKRPVVLYNDRPHEMVREERRAVDKPGGVGKQTVEVEYVLTPMYPSPLFKRMYRPAQAKQREITIPEDEYNTLHNVGDEGRWVLDGLLGESFEFSTPAAEQKHAGAGGREALGGPASMMMPGAPMGYMGMPGMPPHMHPMGGYPFAPPPQAAPGAAAGNGQHPPPPPPAPGQTTPGQPPHAWGPYMMPYGYQPPPGAPYAAPYGYPLLPDGKGGAYMPQAARPASSSPSSSSARFPSLH